MVSMVWGIVGTILAIASLIAIVVVEWLRRPDLDIVVGTWRPRDPMPWTFAVVHVRNKPLWGWLQTFLVRSAAQGCEVTLEFREEGMPGLAVRQVTAKWSHLEPFRESPVPVGQDQVVMLRHFEPSLVHQTMWFDVPAGTGSYEVALAIKRDDGSAHAFGADSYDPKYELWKNPDLELKPLRYDVTVTVNGSGVTRSERFRLNNLTNDFGAFGNLTKL